MQEYIEAARKLNRKKRLPVYRAVAKMAGSDDEKEDEIKPLPRCPHCGAVPIACKQPNDCKFESLQK